MTASRFVSRIRRGEDTPGPPRRQGSPPRLGALRRRLNELPQDKRKEIVCFCKLSLRGYEAATMVAANGWTDVKVMEGGIAAWPFPREK